MVAGDLADGEVRPRSGSFGSLRPRSGSLLSDEVYMMCEEDSDGKLRLPACTKFMFALPNFARYGCWTNACMHE